MPTAGAAFHDPLTGLPNRALLSDRATQAFARAGYTGASVAIMVVDLGAFEPINDQYGIRGAHPLGPSQGGSSRSSPNIAVAAHILKALHKSARLRSPKARVQRPRRLQREGHR